jgi:hypothetical protein
MRSAPSFLAAFATIATLTTYSPHADADDELPMFIAKPGEIKIDGVLRDWGGTPFAALSETLQGTGGGTRVRAALAYDERYLYIAANVVDPKLVRTSSYGAGEDHAELALSFPDDQGSYGRVYELKLYAGDPGKVAGQVKAAGLGVVASAEIVEAPARDGYTFEAKIPWSLFPPAATNRLKIRGAIRYYDSNGRGISSILSTAPKGRAADLPLLTLAAEQSVRAGLLREKSIVAGPSVDVVANVTGDAMKERVQLYDSYLVVFGPHFRGGTEYYWTDLGVDPKSGELPMFEVRDLTGDGKAEIVLRKRVGKGGGWRELLEVLSFANGDAPQTVFEHETGISSSVGQITNDVKLIPSGRGAQIQISLDAASGYTADNFHEPMDTSRPALLLPWGSVRSRTFGWVGTSFVKQTEQSQKPGAAAPPRPAAPPAPRPPTSDELLDQVFALYRKDHGIAANAKPSFDFVTNVGADEQTERIICHGRDLVVFGKGFREGLGYVSLNMPQFEHNEDIAHVTARDLTGDGLAEIIVRGRQSAKAPEDIGEGTVVREVLFAYSVSESAITRIFGAETALTFEDKRIQSSLAFLAGEPGLEIEIRPGRAVGWDRRTWPYKQDSESVSGLEPIVLPWADTPHRYRFDGTRYVK